MWPTCTTRPAARAAAATARASATETVRGFSTKQWRTVERQVSATARWLSAGVTTSTASTCGSAAWTSATARARSTPCPTAHSRRAGSTSVTQTVAPSWVRTRRCFSPQRPSPTRRTFIRALLVDQRAAQVLRHLVAEPPVLHPAHDQQVGGGHEDPVQHAVLGPAESPRAVAHGHFQHAVAAHPEQRGDEPVEAAVEHEAAQALAAERAEGAPAVLDRLVAEPVAGPVGDPRRGAAYEAVAVAAMGAPPRHRVPAVEMREQRRDVVRVVLEIRIHGDDQTAAGGLEPRVGGRRLARVGLQPDEANPRVGVAEASDDLGTPVAAAVV